MKQRSAIDKRIVNAVETRFIVTTATAIGIRRDAMRRVSTIATAIIFFLLLILKRLHFFFPCFDT